MVTDTQRRARNKWDAANMVVLGCKVRKEYADQVRRACQDNGDTVNAVLKAALDAYLQEHGQNLKD